MKKLFIIFFLILTTILYSEDSKNNDEYLVIANKYIDHLRNSEWDTAYTLFDSTMLVAFPPEKIESTWNSIIKQLGEFETIVNSEVIAFNGKKVATLTCKFKVMYADIRCVFDKKMKLAGFFIAPNYSYSNYDQPQYVNLDKFEEIKLKFGKKDLELDAVLSIPKKDSLRKTQLFPVVILVHGSGPNDMDESIGPNKPFKDLAWGLASKGIAVFRYNKRTNQHPSKLIDNLNDFTLNEEVIDDVIEAINKVINTPDINPKNIFILGHSLGGMSIPRIVERDNALAGVIIMAGNARPMQELLLDQYNYIFNADGDLSDEEQVFLDSCKIQVARVNDISLSKETPMKMLPLHVNAAYWLDIRNYYPAELAKKQNVRMLILQGERDYQVTMTDFNLWKSNLEGKKKVTFKLYPSLNHLFMEGESKSTPEEYFIKSHIPEYVIDDIVKFIKEK